MYTDRKLDDQHGYKKNGDEGNLDLHGNSIQNFVLSSHRVYPESEMLSHEGFNSHSIVKTISTSHIKSLFHSSKEKLFEHPSQVLNSILLCSEYEFLMLFLDALRCRYEWVYTHSVNVALLSLMIADGLHLDEKQQEALAVGALLHDAGKLRVPKAILEKESALSDEEMALMKKHSEFGINLVAAYGLPKEILDVIIQHHERLDGSGYPYGLQSEQISRFAKITMIADVIDAITSQRPYRPARDMDTALQIVRKEGAKFCIDYVSIVENLFLTPLSTVK